MNTHRRPTVTERDIQAYVDGRLEAGTEHADAVEAHLAADPEARARVRAYTRQNELIRVRYSDMLAEPVPERLTPGSLRAARAGRVPDGMSMSWRVAAGLAGLGCAAVIGWLAGQSTDTPLEQFADRTAVYLAGDHETAPAGDDVESYQSVAALGGTPDFAAEGLALVGTRRVDNGDMYEARYEDARGRELRLLVAPDPQRHNDLLYRTQENGRKAVYWQQGPLMYALTGDFNEKDLDGLANVAIERLGDELATGQFARTEMESEKLPGGGAPISASSGDASVLDTENLQASQSGLDGAPGQHAGGNDATSKVNPETQMNQPLPQ